MMCIYIYISISFYASLYIVQKMSGNTAEHVYLSICMMELYPDSPIIPHGIVIN
jgi:hypothetical protein